MGGLLRKYFSLYLAQYRLKFCLKELLNSKQSVLMIGDYLFVHVPVFVLFFKKMCIGALLFYVHGKHLRSCRDGQLT